MISIEHMCTLYRQLFLVKVCREYCMLYFRQLDNILCYIMHWGDSLSRHFRCILCDSMDILPSN